MTNITVIKIKNGYLASYPQSGEQVTFYYPSLFDLASFIGKFYDDYDYLNNRVCNVEKEEDESITGDSESFSDWY